MKRLVLIVILVVISIQLGSFFYQKDFAMNTTDQTTIKIDNRKIKKIKVGEKTLEVEVVQDQFSLKKGLSGRDQIGSDGMLFIMPDEQIAAFWMKEMKMDLDIIWIKDSEVVEITRDVPKPVNKDDKLLLYSPSQPINKVLEVVAGDSQKFGIQVGDLITQE